MAALTPKSIPLSTLALGVALALAPPAIAGDVSVKLDAGTGFSVKDSTGAVERLRVDEATGNISRNGALFVHTTGTNNTFVGVSAGSTSTTGYGRNSAFGNGALRNNTTGYFNSAVGYAALRENTTGFRNSAVGTAALTFNSTGFQNAAVGYGALAANTTGFNSSAVGRGALSSNTTGSRNSAVGVWALYHNRAGRYNSAFGYSALRYTEDSDSNSAFGSDALRRNFTGANNAAVGSHALYLNTTGSRNVAIGSSAGSSQTTGNDNIYLANVGVAAESGAIRIGTSPTHTAAFIAGINGTNVGGGASGVFVNASGQLGTVASSGRFKEAVEDMGEASDSLMALRPVRFRYRKDAGGDGHTQEYGLIAEEVAAVAPELVVYDGEGKPFTVKYHEMAPMLLNEMQKQQRTIEKQAGVIEAQRREMQAHEDERQQEIAALATRLARLETGK